MPHPDRLTRRFETSKYAKGLVAAAALAFTVDRATHVDTAQAAAPGTEQTSVPKITTAEIIGETKPNRREMDKHIKNYLANLEAEVAQDEYKGPVVIGLRALPDLGDYVYETKIKLAISDNRYPNLLDLFKKNLIIFEYATTGRTMLTSRAVSIAELNGLQEAAQKRTTTAADRQEQAQANQAERQARAEAAKKEAEFKETPLGKRVELYKKGLTNDQLKLINDKKLQPLEDGSWQEAGSKNIYHFYGQDAYKWNKQELILTVYTGYTGKDFKGTDVDVGKIFDAKLPGGDKEKLELIFYPTEMLLLDENGNQFRYNPSTQNDLKTLFVSDEKQWLDYHGQQPRVPDLIKWPMKDGVLVPPDVFSTEPQTTKDIDPNVDNVREASGSYAVDSMDQRKPASESEFVADGASPLAERIIDNFAEQQEFLKRLKMKDLTDADRLTWDAAERTVTTAEKRVQEAIAKLLFIEAKNKQIGDKGLDTQDNTSAQQELATAQEELKAARLALEKTADDLKIPSKYFQYEGQTVDLQSEAYVNRAGQLAANETNAPHGAEIAAALGLQRLENSSVYVGFDGSTYIFYKNVLARIDARYKLSYASYDSYNLTRAVSEKALSGGIDNAPVNIDPTRVLAWEPLSITTSTDELPSFMHFTADGDVRYPDVANDRSLIPGQIEYETMDAFGR